MIEFGSCEKSEGYSWLLTCIYHWKMILWLCWFSIKLSVTKKSERMLKFSLFWLRQFFDCLFSFSNKKKQKIAFFCKCKINENIGKIGLWDNLEVKRHLEHKKTAKIQKSEILFFMKIPKKQVNSSQKAIFQMKIKTF